MTQHTDTENGHSKLPFLMAIEVVNAALDLGVAITTDLKTYRIVRIEGANAHLIPSLLSIVDIAKYNIIENEELLQRMGIVVTGSHLAELHDIALNLRWDVLTLLTPKDGDEMEAVNDAKEKQKDTSTTNNDPSIKQKVRKRISEVLVRLSPAIADVTLTIDPVTLDITRIDGDKRNALGNLLSALDTAVTADKLRWNSNPPADGDDEHVLQEVITEYRLNIVTLIDECEESHDI